MNRVGLDTKSPHKWAVFALRLCVSAFVAAALLSGAAAVAQERSLACTLAGIQGVAPSDTTIVAAEWLDAPVKHCRIDGYVTANNPGPNKNNFRLQLPESSLWAKRFFFIGVGGSGGYVPTDSQVPGGNPIEAGFAVAGTDKGHQTDSLDWSFADDPAKALDNAHRGAHVTTVATQAITRAFYGADSMYRYEAGCSGGGDMGMRAMQYHPQDYDGVLLGWIGGPYPGDDRKSRPAHNFSVAVREMTREPGSWLSPAKRQFLQDQALQLCDMGDGAKDDMIWDTRQCKIDLGRFACKGADGPACLTPPELTTVINIERDTPWSVTNINNWNTYLGTVPPPWDPSPSRENAPKTSMAYVIVNGWARTYLNQPNRDVIKDPLTEAEVAAIHKGQLGKFEYPGGPWDLSGYERAGGKAIFYVGVGDPAFPHAGMENWFKIWTDKIGATRRDHIGRLYQVPGWGHCGGGTGPNDGADVMLQALVNWVEKKQAPEGLEMHRGAERAKSMIPKSATSMIGVAIGPEVGAPRDFLVCRYPMISVFDRSKANVPGAVNEARNWSCQMPRK